MTHSKSSTIIEASILFGVLFLPGYLSQNSAVDFGMFEDPLFHYGYLIQSLPQIALLVYLFSLKSPEWRKVYGLTTIGWRNVTAGVAVCAVFWLFLLTLGLVLSPSGTQEAGLRWRMDDPRMIPLVLITSILTGYREELFFRSYLIRTLSSLGTDVRLTVALSSVLFGLGHIYQGVTPFLLTTAFGMVMAAVYLKRGNIHETAIGHALYNASVIVLGLIAG